MLLAHYIPPPHEPNYGFRLCVRNIDHDYSYHYCRPKIILNRCGIVFCSDVEYDIIETKMIP